MPAKGQYKEANIVHRCACGCGFKFDTSRPPYRYPSYRRDHKYVVGHEPKKSGYKLSNKRCKEISIATKKAMADISLRKRMSAIKKKQYADGLKCWISLLPKNHPFFKQLSKRMASRKVSKQTKDKISDSLRLAYSIGLREPPNRIKVRYKTGWFDTPKGRFYLDSGAEREYLESLNYKKIKSIQRNFKIPYQINGVCRTFFVDFFLIYKDGTKALIEIKGTHFYRDEFASLKAKFSAAKRYCRKHGINWHVVWSGNMRLLNA